VKIKYLLLVASALTFLACGGGGGGGDTPPADDDDTPTATTQTYNIQVPSGNDFTKATDANSIFDISTQTTNTAPTLRKSYGDIGDIEKIVKRIIDSNETTAEVPPILVDVNVTANEDECSLSTDTIKQYYDSHDIDENYYMVRYSTSFVYCEKSPENETPTYWTQDSDSPNQAYIVRKSDGKTISSDLGPVTLNSFNPIAMLDQNGSFYVKTQVSSVQGVYKVDITDDNQTLMEKVSLDADDDTVSWFCVDKYGNIAYDGSDYRYIKVTDGSLLLLPGTALRGEVFIVLDLDGNMLYHDSDMPNGLDYKKIDGQTYTLTDYGTVDVNGFIITIARISDKNTTVIQAGGAHNHYISEIVNNEGQVRHISAAFLNLSNIEFMVGSDNYYYVSGRDANTTNYVIRKVDPDTDAMTTILDGGYTVEKLSVTGNDKVHFSGLRLSDATSILGKISPEGNLEIIDNLSSTEEINTITAIK
jgi:hypothetical protein